ncbi:MULTISPECIES: phytanoyl-CoA dioxygenase family protein [unclassified Streptomyces]|uniref:phytanoyl-CoA dioxygenase family protein n=1 Tax=unclassified Streptomyces TaxID=2593676 RepID=UPI001F036897|nr:MULTISPECIES: phytanoyl-CoA dioxygenase family protein [unclassified Streptomyces]MCH0564640.1 phytanoyl-CoA dioxygenase family protein [Streptomyces sp. MUM 2J]MCH0570340.1 phytanoyl-CoA dioxygenase family protein [Streptomyces sp. MUM 136J]
MNTMGEGALEKAKAEYAEQGFSIIRNVVPRDLLDEVRAHVEWLTHKYPDLRPEHLHHPLIRNDAFWARLVSDPRLVDIGEFFLGPDLACFTAHYICKPPYDGQPVLWHQDGAYWTLSPMEALTVWLAVDESTTENGCLRMIPGSHELPLHKPLVRTDEPNMLFSTADENLVREWVEKRGVVDIELEPGDVSIHHPHLLHYSEANTSAKRRCGLDIGYISTTTRIHSEGIYLDPLLVRGTDATGRNKYRPFPAYQEGETIPFAGRDQWDDKVAVLNGALPASSWNLSQESPIETTRHMIDRLREGTVKS